MKLHLLKGYPLGVFTVVVTTSHAKNMPKTSKQYHAPMLSPALDRGNLDRGIKGLVRIKPTYLAAVFKTYNLYF